MKMRANRKPPLPSFQDKVNELGYKTKTIIIGAINASIEWVLESAIKDKGYIVMVDRSFTFNHFPTQKRKYKRLNYQILL